MKKVFVPLIWLVSIFAAAVPAAAHCPLCVVGAGAAAAGAAYLGVKHVVIGLFLGAFSFAFGWWLAKEIRFPPRPWRFWFWTLSSFFFTIWPLKGKFAAWNSLYFPRWDWVYLYNGFTWAAVLGALIVLVSPFLSRKLKEKIGRRLVPFQTLLITFTLLFLLALWWQFG